VSDDRDERSYAQITRGQYRRAVALGDGAVSVLVALATYVGRDGVAWPSVKVLAELAGIDRRTCQRRLRRLTDAGVVEILSDGGGLSSARYRVGGTRGASAAPPAAPVPPPLVGVPAAPVPREGRRYDPEGGGASAARGSPRGSPVKDPQIDERAREVSARAPGDAEQPDPPKLAKAVPGRDAQLAIAGLPAPAAPKRTARIAAQARPTPAERRRRKAAAGKAGTLDPAVASKRAAVAARGVSLELLDEALAVRLHSMGGKPKGKIGAVSAHVCEVLDAALAAPSGNLDAACREFLRMRDDPNPTARPGSHNLLVTLIANGVNPTGAAPRRGRREADVAPIEAAEVWAEEQRRLEAFAQSPTREVGHG